MRKVTVQLYLDGDDQPVVDVEAVDFDPLRAPNDKIYVANLSNDDRVFVHITDEESDPMASPLERKQQIRNLLEDQVDLFLDVLQPQGPAFNPLTNEMELVIYAMFVKHLETAMSWARRRVRDEMSHAETSDALPIFKFQKGKNYKVHYKTPDEKEQYIIVTFLYETEHQFIFSGPPDFGTIPLYKKYFLSAEETDQAPQVPKIVR